MIQGSEAVSEPPPPDAASVGATALELLNENSTIFVAAFVVTLLATPLIGRFAERLGIVDQPDFQRKNHRKPVPYLGGVAVFLGLAAGVLLSSLLRDADVAYARVPATVVLGMAVVLLTGLADDVWHWNPFLKVGGQLFAAAALAMEDVGIRVAEGVLMPLMGVDEKTFVDLGLFALTNGDVYYWVGTALIAIFVLGGCNSANLLDGLDGLLSGVVTIGVIGLLAISLLMVDDVVPNAVEPSLAAARIVMCVAVLGAVLGFLPYNFKPATIFLGDCGSLLLGYSCAAIILMLGELGQTHLVFAGLIVFSLPIMDTTLAIIRRWLARVPLSAADDQHLHHQLCHSLGGVRRAVLSLYGISVLFTVVGVTLAWLTLRTELRVRVVYAFALVLFSFIGVTAVKTARRRAEAMRLADGRVDRRRTERRESSKVG